MKKLVLVIAAFWALGSVGLFVGCGGGGGTKAGAEDGGGDGTSNDGELSDGTLDTGTPVDGSGAKDSSGGDSSASGDSGKGDGGPAPSDASLSPDVFGGGDSGCVTLGSACTTAGECCTGSCAGGFCAYPACGQTGQACSSNGQCCSQTCTSGKCATISTCGILGLACTTDAQCCSGNCVAGACQPSSFCSQTGDICSGSSQCCSGTCTIPSGKSVGTCNAPVVNGNCTQVDGMLCTPVSSLDGGCGGSCCSRACGPWGPTGVNVCQPATGCHVENDTCTKDSDCCGSQAFIDAGLPTSMNPVMCVGGYCTQHMGCAPNGDVCKLATTSCNANCDCCAGNCEKLNTCKQDNVGVPRCANLVCGAGGAACASSADCCNGDPCVPNPKGSSPPYVCATTACVPSCSTCSTSADCCPGYSCISGVCDPCGGGSNPDGGVKGDGGTGSSDGGGKTPDGGTCSLFGQLCDPDAGVDCCPNLNCYAGRCMSL